GQGLTEAQYTLGGVYALGQGVIQDYVQAHMWGNIARSNGSAKSEKLLTLLEEQMTASQISEAQTAARDCVAKGYKGC
ncbi:MAG: sel1 repeat family protein, partial [Alphaproteobacteria bacterium]